MKEILSAIAQYAEAYARLEKLQRTRTEIIPTGDQKTGAIAEFYAGVLARHMYPEAEITFGPHSQTAWDIRVTHPHHPERLIQVKAVSAHSMTGRISPIHGGWHLLWLMRLDVGLQPEAIWCLEANQVPCPGKGLHNRTMPKPGLPESGSSEFRERMDLTPTLREALASLLP